jgi:hypothetical protein
MALLPGMTFTVVQMDAGRATVLHPSCRSPNTQFTRSDQASCAAEG